MAIPTTTSTFEVSRSTTPGEVSSLKGNAHSFTFTLPDANTYNSYDSLTLQIHKRGLAGDGNTLVSQTNADPTGTSQTFAVSDSGMSLAVSGARTEYGMVLYGLTGAVSDKLWIGKLYLYAHHAASDAVPPDSPELYINADEAAATYAPLASPALTGTPTAPTATPGTNTTQIATTAFVIANAGGISDGDKGDITVSASGATWTIDNGVVTNAKAADMATATIKGRATAGTGDPEDLSITQAKTLLALENVTNTSDANKPVSTAQQTALNLKADLAGCSFTGPVIFDNDGLEISSGASVYLSNGATFSADVGALFSYGAGTAATHRAALGLVPGTDIPSGSGTSSGTNTGDQTSIVGITGTTAQFNTANTDGDFATLAGSETLTNKTLTAPKIASGGFIADANGNELMILNTTAGAVNEITLANAATAGKPTITASGGDTNITINLVPKGSGTVQSGGVDILNQTNVVSSITNKSFGTTYFTTSYASVSAYAHNGSYYIGIAATSSKPKLFTTIEHDITIQTNSTATNTATKDHMVFSHANGSVGMGTASPSTKCLLELSSTTRGFLPPRMTGTERDAITSVPAGLMVYNTTTNKLNFYNGGAWEAVTSA